ncbi:hypothetical protein ACFWPX_24295 [Nocardia sp. NPDC058518]|uniref:hypothetical protein n=1 Tax=Nocardia sp. NPDC058518 TaxID=3346534 RepID=UPI00365EAA18
MLEHASGAKTPWPGAARDVPRDRSVRVPRDAVDVAAAGTVVAAAALGALTLLATITTTDSRTTVAVTAALLAVCLPIYLRHIACAVRDAIPPAGHRTSVVLATLVMGASPLVGAGWLNSVHLVAVVIALTLRPALAMPIALALVAAVAPLATLLGASAPETIWLAVTTGMQVVAVYTLVWMVVALRRLRGAAAVLAEQAVAKERLRIDAAITRTVETALESIAESCDRAAEFTTHGDAAAARTELGTLVATARSGLSEARGLIHSFQEPDFRREIISAAALLTAAGIDARIDLPAAGPPTPYRDPLRAELRRVLAGLLRDGPTGPVLIAVHQVDAHWLLSCTVGVSSDGNSAASIDAADSTSFARTATANRRTENCSRIAGST